MGALYLGLGRVVGGGVAANAPRNAAHLRVSIALRLGSWAHGVVVSHPLCMRKALGSNPSVSILYCAFCVCSRQLALTTRNLGQLLPCRVLQEFHQGISAKPSLARRRRHCFNELPATPPGIHHRERDLAAACTLAVRDILKAGLLKYFAAMCNAGDRNTPSQD